MWPFNKKPNVVVRNEIKQLAIMLASKESWCFTRNSADWICMHNKFQPDVKLSFMKFDEFGGSGKWACSEELMTTEENQFISAEFTKLKDKESSDILQAKRDKFSTLINNIKE